MTTTCGRLKITNCRSIAGHEDLERDVREGLTADGKYLPCKYFYDARGSVLFERICLLPEYYQTRTELSILQAAAPLLMAELREGRLIELGSGCNRKIRLLLDAANGTRSGITYVPVDVCEPAMLQSARDLLRSYPDLAVSGMIADFHHDLDRLLGKGDKLITFFGSTLGNFSAEQTRVFLKSIASSMQGRDRFLLGLDLIKEKKALEAAYNDAQGVTAEFNRNILAVLNRELSASFDPASFDHVAFFNEDSGCIEMHLRATRRLVVPIRGLNMEVEIQEGETIFTEISRKFRTDQVEDMAAEAGFRVGRWFTDPREWFAVAELAPGG